MPTAAPDRVTCPGCKTAFKTRPELAGKRVKCKCGAIITIPGAAAAPAAKKSAPPRVAPPPRVTAPPPEEEPLRPDPLPADPPPQPDDIYDVSEPADPVKPIKPPPLAAAAQAQATPAAKPDQMPSMYRPRGPVKIDPNEQKNNLIRLTLIVVALVLVVGGAIAGMEFFGGSGAPAKPMLGEDGEVAQMMNDQPYKEVHAWFAQDHDRIMGPWSESQAIHMAETWQKQGAKQTLAFGSRMSLVAVIELPDDPTQRQPIFDWQANWHKQHMEKVVTDVGQKYLIIRLPP